MIAPRHARIPFALAVAFGVAAACTKGARSNGDSAAATGATSAAAPAPAAPRAQMGMMMGDSAMIMLDGFCGAEAGDSAMGSRVDLIVNGDAAQHASHVMINVVSAAPGELKAELVAGRDAHAMCGGRARRIYIGGTTMFLGNPTLTLSSAVPVTVAARSTLGAMLGAPVDVKPGQKGAVLKWDAAAVAKP
jgi:hypothetical protein